jgi:predicted anti-sigma-YlaC factor YlaD
MHQPIRERLEQYLGGTEDAGGVRRIESHLAECGKCRRQVEGMRRQAALLRVLRPEAELDPAPGFYARVMDRIETQRSASVWSILLEPVFAKRLAYASLALLVLLGTLALSVDTEPVVAPSTAEVIMVEDPIGPPLGADPVQDRDVVLVNLATYQY